MPNPLFSMGFRQIHKRVLDLIQQRSSTLESHYLMELKWYKSLDWIGSCGKVFKIEFIKFVLCCLEMGLEITKLSLSSLLIAIQNEHRHDQHDCSKLYLATKTKRLLILHITWLCEPCGRDISVLIIHDTSCYWVIIVSPKREWYKTLV